MQRVFLLILLAFSGLVYGQTYSELAQQYINPKFNQVMDGLNIVDADVTASEVKSLRKDIGMLKIYLDVFQYAYNKDRGVDLLVKIRREIDDGYEVIGHFKDLSDTLDPNDVSTKEIEKRRKKVLSWKKSFRENTVKNHYQDYLESPIVNDIYKRPKEELPKFFWAVVTFPEEKISQGNAVIKHLLNEMMLVAFSRYEDVIEFETVLETENEEHFHDFRKMVRAHINLVDTFFEETIQQDSHLALLKKTLIETITKFGDLNDLLTGLKDTKNPDKKKKLKKKIKNAWGDLKQWCLEASLDEVLLAFRFQ